MQHTNPEHTYPSARQYADVIQRALSDRALVYADLFGTPRTAEVAQVYVNSDGQCAVRLVGGNPAQPGLLVACVQILSAQNASFTVPNPDAWAMHEQMLAIDRAYQAGALAAEACAARGGGRTIQRAVFEMARQRVLAEAGITDAHALARGWYSGKSTATEGKV